IVSMTETINGTFGSLLVAEPFGVILNNQMDDFAANPGRPNLYGLIQGQANAIAPGKRPLSSMSPTIVLKAGRPVLALGGSGGPRIITSVLQVLLNVVRFEMPLEEAVAAVRLHHQWLPDEVYFDREPPADVRKALEAAGQEISVKRSTGIVQAIQIMGNGAMIGASDPRKGGRPAGVKPEAEPVPAVPSGP
ncbi:MAG: gamma-glutamyltransferase family protein, partial [Chlorobiales bacterium]|nr:gamma-glutamyltransferase family protein [Chlorobiales bacterium]